MMVLVDTSVWVDGLNGRETPGVQRLRRCIAEGDTICACGVVLAETLQGIRDDAQFEATRRAFEGFFFLPMSRATCVDAAQLYRGLRKRGVTVRKPADCLIAAVAIEHGVHLLHSDRDFDVLAKYGRLKVVTTV